jgi:hypothetical protein
MFLEGRNEIVQHLNPLLHRLISPVPLRRAQGRTHAGYVPMGRLFKVIVEFARSGVSHLDDAHVLTPGRPDDAVYRCRLALA